jgi:IS5 family transposase
MRETIKNQMPLTPPSIDHPKATELEAISHILDENHSIVDLVHQDLFRDAVRRKGDAKGMSAEQVLRAAILKQMHEYTYRDLSFHIADSETVLRFMRMEYGDRSFKHSALQANISRIQASTWEAINRVLLDWAKAERIDKGRQVRIDCTVVETNIHPPSDSSLLYDCVRVLTRLLKQGRRKWDAITFENHNRRAKRRMIAVLNAKNKKARAAAYRDLLTVTGLTIRYPERALDRLEAAQGEDAFDFTWKLIANYIQ